MSSSRAFTLHQTGLMNSVSERAFDNIEGDGVDLDIRNFSNFYITHAGLPFVMLRAESKYWNTYLSLRQSLATRQWLNPSQ